MESDLENVRALVGDLGGRIFQFQFMAHTILVDASGDNSAPPSLITGTNLSNMQPVSRTELLEYADLLKKKISEFESLPSYAFFAETVVRDLVACLNVDDSRKISSCLTAIVNEKQKILKESQGKGKKKASAKKTVNVSARGEFENYADGTILDLFVI